jgi:hypothetical protein
MLCCTGGHAAQLIGLFTFAYAFSSVSGGKSPVQSIPLQMWEGEPSQGADVGGGEPNPGAAVGRGEPGPAAGEPHPSVQMWQG